MSCISLRPTVNLPQPLIHTFSEFLALNGKTSSLEHSRITSVLTMTLYVCIAQKVHRGYIRLLTLVELMFGHTPHFNLGSDKTFTIIMF